MYVEIIDFLSKDKTKTKRNKTKKQANKKNKKIHKKEKFNQSLVSVDVQHYLPLSVVFHCKICLAVVDQVQEG